VALDFPYRLIDPRSMDIQFTTRILKEGRTFVAHTPELDVSSCGGSREKAAKNLKEAVRLFLEEAEKLGTLEQILEEAGYLKRRSRLEGPKFIGTPKSLAASANGACQSLSPVSYKQLGRSLPRMVLVAFGKKATIWSSPKQV